MVGSIYGFQSASLVQVLQNKNAQMEELTVQLGTGRSSQTYGGLGAQAGRSLDLRSQIADIDGYRSTITQAKLQISMMNNALQRITKIGAEISGSASAAEYNITAQNRSVGQMTSETYVKEMLGLLDTDVDGDYVFSGTTTDVSPTLNFDQIVNGMNGKDGLLTVTDERIRADAGTDKMGRLTTSVSSSIFTLSEQTTDFGYKLGSVSNSLSNATVTGPTGTPPSVNVAFSDKPKVNEVISFTFKLPDGSNEVIALRASDKLGEPGDGTFYIGGTTDDIAQSLNDRLSFAIKKNVSVEGEAASRIQASMDFYMTSGGGEPKRVVGSPPETATTLDTATKAGKPTVEWYVGDNNANSARDTAKALVDKDINVAYGARANEDGIARQLAYMTAFSLPTYDGDNSTDKARYSALADAISGGLSSNHQGEKVSTIQTELGVASKMIVDTDKRHKVSSSMLKTASDEVDGINKEEIAAKLMSLKSTIEASYKATSIIYQLSLTKYI